MAMTEVKICNMALGLLGADTTISALTDDTQNARTCNLWYEQTRDRLLRSHPWNFAVKRAFNYPDYDATETYQADDYVEYSDVVYKSLQSSNTGNTPGAAPLYWEATSLNIIDEADDPAGEWDNAYTLPSDCLRVLYVNETRDNYRIEADTLVTNESDVMLVYVAQITDPTKFDALFVRALSYSLAIDMAPYIARSSQRQVELVDAYRKLVLREAASMDAFEAEGDAYIRTEWMEARQ